MQKQQYAMAHLDGQVLHRIFDASQPEKTAALVTADADSKAGDWLLAHHNAAAAMPHLVRVGVPAMVPFSTVLKIVMELVVDDAYPALNKPEADPDDRRWSLATAIYQTMRYLGLDPEELLVVRGEQPGWLGEIYGMLEETFPQWVSGRDDASRGWLELDTDEFVDLDTLNGRQAPGITDEELPQDLTLEILTSNLQDYCSKHGLPQVCAEELLAGNDLTERQREWIWRFVVTWTSVERREEERQKREA